MEKGRGSRSEGRRSVRRGTMMGACVDFTSENACEMAANAPPWEHKDDGEEVDQASLGISQTEGQSKTSHPIASHNKSCWYAV